VATPIAARLTLREEWLMKIDVAYVIAGLLAAVGCASSKGGSVAADAAAPVDIPGHTPGMPGLGAYAMTHYRYHANSPSSLSTPPMVTQGAGSMMVVAVARGDDTRFALPTDNKGNTAQQLGAMHTYTRWPTSGTAVYAFPSVAGGSNYMISTTTDPADEITMAAIEVIEGSKIQDTQWNEVMSGGGPLTTKSVTTTGPATLIAFWWGDGFFDNTPQNATANNGFVVVGSVVNETGSFVQGAVAVKNVTAAGTYDVTWTATPEQGAQLWLIAVQ
jgi:hypothetical protein